MQEHLLLALLAPPPESTRKVCPKKEAEFREHRNQARRRR